MAEQEYQIRNKHMLVAAGLLGLLAVLLVNWHIWQIRRENAQDLIPVICAKKDLLVGDRLSPDNMGTRPLPMSLVPTEMLDDVARYADYYTLLNMEVKQDVAKDRILRWSYVGGGTSVSGDPGTPRVGYKLVALEVDRSTCPAELSRGKYVDLMTTLAGRTIPVIERVLVKTLSGPAGNVNAVSVEVLSEDALKLEAYKNGLGKKNIALWTRNPEEKVSQPKFNPEVERLLGASGGPSRN